MGYKRGLWMREISEVEFRTWAQGLEEGASAADE